MSPPSCLRAVQSALIERYAVNGAKARLRQLVKTRFYTLILREKSEPGNVHIRIILKYAGTHVFIEVLLSRRPYYARGIVRQLFAYRGQSLLACGLCGDILKFRQQYNVQVALPAALLCDPVI